MTPGLMLAVLSQVHGTQKAMYPLPGNYAGSTPAIERLGVPGKYRHDMYIRRCIYAPEPWPLICLPSEPDPGLRPYAR